MSDLEALVFEDLEPISLPVRIGPKNYVLKEATEDVVCKYRNATLKAARMTEGRVTGVDGIVDAEPILVAGCLFRVDDGGQHRPLTVQEIRSWPNRIVSPLFEKAMEISGLREPDTLEALTRRRDELQERIDQLQGRLVVNGEVEAGPKN